MTVNTLRNIISNWRQRAALFLKPVTDRLDPYVAPLRARWAAFAVARPTAAKWIRRFGRVFLFFYAIYLLFIVGLFGDIPSVSELQELQTQTASEVYSADGALLGRLYSQNRTLIKFKDLPHNLVHALVATEDVRFFEHGGVDFRSYMRVLFKTVIGGDESSGGGSTLSQQIAKNLFPRKKYWISFVSTPINKFREAIIAGRLERAYSKEDLLALYLNTVPFPNNAFGIDVAARRFFSTIPAKLTPEQSALLVGTLKATTAYNPRKNPERSIKRRNIVLDQMAQFPVRQPDGLWLKLDKVLTDSLKKIPLALKYNIESTNEGIAPHYRDYLRLEVLPKILDSLALKKSDGTPYDMYKDGLKIYTTIDSTMQQYAEEATREHMSKLQQTFDNHWSGMLTYDTMVLEKLKETDLYSKLKKQDKDIGEIISAFKRAKKHSMTVLTWGGEREQNMNEWDSVKHYVMLMNAGFMVMEPETGFVRAWVGGHNFKYSQYDHVRSKRQVGSIFKPIVYAAALNAGLRPCEYYSNQHTTYHLYDTWEVKDPKKKDLTPHINPDTRKDEDDWTPQNVDGRYGGYLSMKEALTNSVNAVSVSLIMQIGAKSVVKMAKDMGITNTIPEEPSIALGSADMSLYEMVNAFGAFGKRGIKSVPAHISRILNAKGEQIYSHEAPKPSFVPRILSEANADIMIKLMQAVVQSGTAGSLRYKYNLNGAVAGKTGTSQNHSDGWFVGLTPNLVGGAWVGCESPAVRFRDMNYGQGSYTALPIWGSFMRKLYDDPRFSALADTKFAEPSPDVLDSLDCAARWWAPGTEEDSLFYTFDSLGLMSDPVLIDSSAVMPQPPVNNDDTPPNKDGGGNNKKLGDLPRKLPYILAG